MTNTRGAPDVQVRGLSRWPLAAAFVAAALAALPAQVPQFRAGVDVVEVEATVLDAERDPVRGLTATHFSIYENGKLQPIVLFSEEQYPEADGPLSTAVEDTAPDVSQRRYSDRRLIALIVDDFALPSSPAASAQLVADMKLIAKDVVAQMGLKDFVSIVHTRDTRYFPDFTNNRRKLFDSINSIEPPLEAEKMYLTMQSRGRMGGMVALLDVVGYMSKWPQHRKTVIYVSRGTGGSVLGGTTMNRLRDLITMARESGISISTIDPSGLRISTSGLTLLQTMAENTGGVSGINSNDMLSHVEQIFHETRSYYLIGYRRTGPNDGKLRKLEVKVNRPGVLVSARSGVYAPGPRDVVIGRPADPFDAEVDVAVQALTLGVGDERRLSTYAVDRNGSLTAVAEITAKEAAAKRWANGATVEATITRGPGTPVTMARGRIEPGSRAALLEIPGTAAGDAPAGTLHFNAKIIAADGSSVEDGTDVRSGSDLLEEPTVYRAGPSARARLSPVAEFQFVRTERMHLEFVAQKPITHSLARVLRRNGQPLGAEPVVSQKSIDGKTVLVAEFSLSFLAPADYAFELFVRSGEDAERKLVAFRVR